MICSSRILHGSSADAATVEISRAQIWQRIHHPKGIMADGRKVTIDLFRQLTTEEPGKIKSAIGEEHYAASHFEEARELLDKIIADEQFVEFLTLPVSQDLS